MAGAFPLRTQKLEQRFGISRGHIHPIDNAFGSADLHAYAAPASGLCSASAGCHPAGWVIGAARNNAARRAPRDMA